MIYTYELAYRKKKRKKKQDDLEVHFFCDAFEESLDVGSWNKLFILFLSTVFSYSSEQVKETSVSRRSF